MKKWYSWKDKEICWPQYPLTDEWINKLGFPHNLAIRGNKLLIFAIIWVDTENIMLGEISQSQDTHLLDSICRKYQNKQIYKDRKQSA